MLIISNLCYGGYFYKYMDQQYNNPFIWCRVFYDSMRYLMDNWEKIDFKNFEVKLSKNPRNSYDVIVDGHILINYPHYLLDLSAEKLLYDTNYDRSMHNYWIGDIRFKDMENYVYSQYLRRVERMLSINEKPCFLLRDDEKYMGYPSKTKMKDIIECAKYKTLIFTDDPELSSDNPNCLVRHIGNLWQTHPEIQIRQNLSEIKSFLL